MARKSEVTSIKPGAKAAPYKSWCYQLAAYRKALLLSPGLGAPDHQRVTCMNLIVNSNEPSIPIEHVWTNAEMELGEAAFDAAHKLWTIEKGYDPAYGARPMRRAVERFLEDPIAEELLRGGIKAGDTVTVSSAGNKLAFNAPVPPKNGESAKAKAGK